MFQTSFFQVAIQRQVEASGISFEALIQCLLLHLDHYFWLAIEGVVKNTWFEHPLIREAPITPVLNWVAERVKFTAEI